MTNCLVSAAKSVARKMWLPARSELGWTLRSKPPSLRRVETKKKNTAAALESRYQAAVNLGGLVFEAVGYKAAGFAWQGVGHDSPGWDHQPSSWNSDEGCMNVSQTLHVCHVCRSVGVVWGVNVGIYAIRGVFGCKRGKHGSWHTNSLYSQRKIPPCMAYGPVSDANE